MDKKIAMFFLCALFVIFVIPSSIFAASFDCGKAKTEVEKLICSNDELSKLDESLSEAYLKALERADIKQQIIGSQRQWLKYERNLCQTVECIKKAYTTRINELHLTSSAGIVIHRDVNRYVSPPKSSPKAPAEESKQEQIKFGAPVRTEDVQASANLLPLSSSQPPRGLAADSEIILISGYKPANEKTAGSTVMVEIDRPGSRVLLILTSNEKINWQVCASPGTTISGILTWGKETPTVTTPIATQGFLVKLPYADETENVKFRDLLNALNSLFDIEKLDAFRGSHSIPSVVRISTLDPPGAELTARGPLPQRPEKNFTFSLITTSYKKAVWSLTGPVHDEDESYIGEGKFAISTSGKVIYRLRDKGLEICDHLDGNREVATLPSNFPEFSHPMDIAYDSKRDIVCVVTLGGEGFLYRFDARRKQWIDFRSLNNIDIFSLSYDKSKDRYVAWTDAWRDHGKLLFISGEGNALFSRDIDVLHKLAGFGRLYDHGNRPPPRITIVPHGDDIVLVYIDGNSVKNIWCYNIKTDTAVFTYQNENRLQQLKQYTEKKEITQVQDPATTQPPPAEKIETGKTADSADTFWGTYQGFSRACQASFLVLDKDKVSIFDCKEAPYTTIESDSEHILIEVKPSAGCTSQIIKIEREKELKFGGFTVKIYDNRKKALEDHYNLYCSYGQVDSSMAKDQTKNFLSGKTGEERRDALRKINGQLHPERNKYNEIGLRDESSLVRETAAWFLRGEPSHFVPVLINVMANDPDAKVRASAGYSLSSFYTSNGSEGYLYIEPLEDNLDKLLIGLKRVETVRSVVEILGSRYTGNSFAPCFMSAKN